jgi:uncharacterized membrane protein YcaP (DUF421 family)
MELFAEVDWARILLPRTPLAETFVRGAVTYFALFTLLRLASKREAAGTSISTLLVVVLIADAAQNAMAGDYTSIADGVLLVATIIGCSVLLDWLGSRFRTFGALTHPPPLLVVRHGRLLPGNMRREMLSEEELWSQLREQGVRSLDEVEKAYLEGDGRLSVLKRRAADGEGSRTSGPASGSRPS